MPYLGSATTTTTFTYDLPVPVENIVQLPEPGEDGKRFLQLPQPVARDMDESGIHEPVIDIASLEASTEQGTNVVSFTLKNFDLDKLKKNLLPGANPKLIVELLNNDGSQVKTNEVVELKISDMTSAGERLKVTLPKGYAVGMMKLQVKLVYNVSSPSAVAQKWETRELCSRVAQLRPHNGEISAQLTRTEVSFNRTDEDGNITSLGSVPFNRENDGIPDYLMGKKVDAVAIAPDGARAFVAGKDETGKNVIWAIDLIAMRIYDTFSPGYDTKNIASIKVSGSYLYAAEGGSYRDANGYNLWRVDIAPGSSAYGKALMVQGETFSPAVAPYGFAGMEIDAQGRVLVLAVPQTSGLPRVKQNQDKAGDLIVIDLQNGLKLENGVLKLEKEHCFTAQIEGENGFSPLHVHAVSDDEFVVTNLLDYSQGLATLKVAFDQNGVTGATLATNKIDLSQPNQDVLLERLNIQRAQDVVVTTWKDPTGKEEQYAIVSDDNLNFLDPLYMAMFEEPETVWAGDGPPVMIGGELSAKTVVVGGKLGIIKDPFGRNGAPVFLGASAPDGGWRYGELSLLGNTLFVGATGMDSNEGRTLAFNANMLIEMAVIHSRLNHDQGRLDVSIGKTSPEDAQPLVLTPAVVPDLSGIPVSSDHVKVENYVIDLPSYRAGDVVTLDLASLIAGFVTRVEQDSEASEMEKTTARAIRETLDKMSGTITRGDLHGKFTIKSSLEVLTQRNDEDGKQRKPGVKLATQTGGPVSSVDQLLSAKRPDSQAGSQVDHMLLTGAKGQSFTGTDILVAFREITENDLKLLRSGKTLMNQETTIKVDLVGEEEQVISLDLNVIFEDYQRNKAIFFGDRPLTNPGYSAFTLSGSVGNGATYVNDPLDVLRVEQRLRYLGYPALKTGKGNNLQDFVVNGKFAVEEQAALKLFEKVVRYEPKGMPATFDNADSIADGKLKTDAKGKLIAEDAESLSWLNAYNAPHWVQLFDFEKYNSNLPGWYNTQLKSGSADVEVYASSWVYDLMAAKQYAPIGLLSGLGDSRFKGTTDANHGFTPTPAGHKSHDLGMAMDLSIMDYVGEKAQQMRNNASQPNSNRNETLLSSIANLPVGSWSVQHALEYSLELQGLPSIVAVDDKNINNQLSALRDFLSLYALTRSDPTYKDYIENTYYFTYDPSYYGYTWDNLYLLMRNEKTEEGKKTIRSAIFGDGTAATGLINALHIGGTNGTNNTYPNMREILVKLGWSTGTYLGPNWYTGKTALPAPQATYGGPHYHHFHIYFNPPEKPTPITANLLSHEWNPENAVSSEMTDSQDLMLQVSRMLSQGEGIMFTLDMPPVPEQEPPVVLVVNNNDVSSAKRDSVDYIVKSCQTSSSDTAVPLYSAERAVHPIWKLYRIAEKTRGITNLPENEGVYKNLHLLTPPKHGYLEKTEEYGTFMYFPETNYIGRDSATFMVEHEGVRYQIFIQFMVSRFSEGAEDCPPDKFIKVKKSVSDAADHDESDWTEVQVSEAAYNDPASWYRATSLQALLSGAKDALTGFSDLSGASLGQTTGNWITLDTDAAGHDWYIDYTPYLNEEYLPTSSPYEWKAAPGSEAEGKMDLLSVLLHEYGHVLGMEHSADSHDAMASTLQPGMRRLPNVEAWLTLQNQQNGILAATQYAIAANPELTNPQFAGDTGWSTTGEVQFSNSMATLKEGAETQTRLNQVFVVGANDRYLRFKITDLVLDDADNAPDDAFEAALIDANTGLSLLSGTGLTKNDAFINLQANGDIFKSNKVTAIDNPDGSRTVIVDLEGIPAGTVVNLSFDLIGFGLGAAATSSHVTISSLSLGGTDEPGTDEPGTDEPGTEEPGTDEPGTDEPGTDEPGTDEPGTDEPGTDEPGTDEPGTDEPGTNEPGTNEPGTNEPGTNEPGTNEPGTDEPGTDEPGTDEPGTNEPEGGGRGRNLP